MIYVRSPDVSAAVNVVILHNLLTRSIINTKRFNIRARDEYIL